MNIVLHIGLPKTGTTFLQQQIAFHRDALATAGVYIPQTATLKWLRSLTGDPVSNRMVCEENNHLMLAWALQPERWPQFPAAVQRLLPKVWDLLIEELAGCGAPYCLITAENLSWDLTNESQFRAIRHSFAGHSVSVVCCIRQLHDFIASQYGQLLAIDRGPYSIDDFVAEFYPKWERDFQEQIWLEAFGVGCFREVAYEAITGPDILQRFLAAAIPGHPSSLRSYPVMLGTDPHQSLSPRFLRFLEELHANAIGSAQFKKLYQSLPESYAPLEHRLISPAEIDAALARHRAGGSELHPELLSSFKCGPNIFDDFKSAERKADRDQAETLNKDLIERTKELVDTRAELLERTKLLEKANADLAARTKELVDTRAELLERTKLLEKANADLAARTKVHAQLEKRVKKTN